MRAVYYTASLLLFVLIPGGAEEGRRDGNWWREQSSTQRTMYVTGFFDGMELGNRFSYWEMPGFKANKKGVNSDSAASKALTSYNTLVDKYLTNITNGQIADGVTKFYEDYRNRTILIHDAVWLVLNSISGKPDSEMETMIEGFRKNAK